MDLDGYASNPDVMAIGASNDRSMRSWYSDKGDAIFLSAPFSGDGAAGERAITTTDRQGSAGYNDGAEGLDADYTNSFGGTSSRATPLVAGIIALMLSTNPDLTVQEVRTALQDSARKIGSGYDEHGHSPEYGFGLVDAYEAVRRPGGSQASYQAAGQPSIIGPANWDHSGDAPQFEVDPGGGNAIYYAVEVATSADLLDGGEHSDDPGFYASWQDSAFFATNSYVLPDKKSGRQYRGFHLLPCLVQHKS